MKVKNLIKTTLAVVFGSLLFASCERGQGGDKPTVVGESYALVGNCKRSDMSAAVALPNGKAITYSAAAPLSASALQKGGTKIIGIRAYIIDG